MIELLFVNVFWALVYLFEALHDINYKTINGIEKYYDGAMFLILHVGFGVVIWYYSGGFWYAFTLTSIGLLIRLNLHDGFIMVFRGLSWFRLPTFDNPNDVFDKILIKLGKTFIWIKIILLFVANSIYYLVWVA